MKKLDFTSDELIDSLNFTESDYKKAAERKGVNANFEEFIKGIMDDCQEYGYTLEDAIFYAEDDFKELSKKTYDVCFDDDNNTNGEGWHESYQYCKDYIESNNGSNWSYFGDYKGGIVSIYCNETGEQVYSERVK